MYFSLNIFHDISKSLWNSENYFLFVTYKKLTHLPYSEYVKILNQSYISFSSPTHTKSPKIITGLTPWKKEYSNMLYAAA